MDRRIKFRENLHEIYLPFYDSLCELLPECWQPVSGFRSFERQAAIYAQGRTLPGNVVTNANAGESAHNYGCATDWTYFKSIRGKMTPTWPDPRDPIWNEYGKVIESIGLKWGKSFRDYPHNELNLSVSWVRIKEYHDKDGHNGVSDALNRFMIK